MQGGYNNNPGFVIKFIPHFQLPDTEKSIIFQHFSGNKRQIPAQIEIKLTGKSGIDTSQ